MNYFEKNTELEKKHNKMMHWMLGSMPMMVIMFFAIALIKRWFLPDVSMEDFFIPWISISGGVAIVQILIFYIKGLFVSKELKKYPISRYDKLAYLTGSTNPNYKESYNEFKRLVDNKEYDKILNVETKLTDKAKMYKRYLDVKTKFETILD